MALRLPTGLRHLRRYRQIITVLIRYGFSDLVEAARAGLVARFGEKFIPAIRLKKAALSRPVRIRLAIEELGPTFIKLGQILSLRPDLIPPEISTELAKLQDQVAPLTFAKIEEVLIAEIGPDYQRIFKQLDPQPLAAASIAQVHRAELSTGQVVAIKIQRPQIRQIIETDLDILHDLAHLVREYFLNELAQDPVTIIQELNKSLHRELDFQQEGRVIRQFQTFFSGEPAIRIPHYFPEYSSGRVLVMDYIEGIKASQVELLEAAGIDRLQVARNGANLSFRQIFELGIFHADPHPGNILVLPGNVIALLDYGMTGQIDEASIDYLGDIIIGILKKDILRLIHALENLTGADLLTDNINLRLDLNSLINDYTGIPLKELKLTAFITDFFDLIRRYKLHLPPHLTMMLKALLTVEGLARILYPEFDIMQELQPWITKIIRRRYEPRRIYRQTAFWLSELEALATTLPRKLQAILNKAAEGDFSIQFKHRNLENLIAQIKKTSNRLSLALIIAALIIGSAILIQAEAGTARIWGCSAIGMLGYLLACLFSLKLFWDIFRDRKL